ncbi:hypothetical protein [Methanolobus halotolerans]|uniref:Uncharacterized protein n=1 Tax=Methanolobus halotolerans TaxID=2052935 RepID=A0A4E0QAD8_9EURY|nr:hypothetical protein [Methanolobus halotolerans]TGC09407.1 hypothetical protein CUN85_06125 [Methanolobus halotolerans]
MSKFSIGTEGIVITDINGDAIFVPKNYISILKMELEGIDSDNPFGTMSAFGFINMSFTESGVHIADDKEGVFLSKQDADKLIEVLKD